MFKKFANSYWFNVLFAVLAGFFIVMQEVWSGGFLVPVLSIAAFAVIGPFFISAGAEIVKMIDDIPDDHLTKGIFLETGSYRWCCRCSCWTYYAFIGINVSKTF